MDECSVAVSFSTSPKIDKCDLNGRNHHADAGLRRDTWTYVCFEVFTVSASNWNRIQSCKTSYNSLASMLVKQNYGKLRSSNKSLYVLYYYRMCYIL